MQASKAMQAPELRSHDSLRPQALSSTHGSIHCPVNARQMSAPEQSLFSEHTRQTPPSQLPAPQSASLAHAGKAWQLPSDVQKASSEQRFVASHSGPQTLPRQRWFAKHSLSNVHSTSRSHALVSKLHRCPEIHSASIRHPTTHRLSRVQISPSRQSTSPRHSVSETHRPESASQTSSSAQF